MTMEIVFLDESRRATATSSDAVRVGDLLFVAGQAAVGDGGVALHPGDVAAQTKHSIGEIERVLGHYGRGLTSVVTVTAYLTHAGDLAAYNEAYVEAFRGH